MAGTRLCVPLKILVQTYYLKNLGETYYLKKIYNLAETVFIKNNFARTRL